GELEAAPYVVIGAQRHVITGAGDELHARGTFDEGESNYGIYRPGDVFVDPASGEVLGQLAREIGGGRLMALEGDIATLLVNRSRSEIRSTDRLLPVTEQKITATFFPSSPQGEVSGEILAVEDGVNQIARLSVVVLNRGARDGLAEGNVLAIKKRGEVVRDPVTGEKLQMPDAQGGMLMVFKTFESMSFGLVLDASLSLAVGDRVANP
ncbi:MAG: peptidoglycan-binding protein, partial [Gammaproteobacteria bacterium]